MYFYSEIIENLNNIEKEIIVGSIDLRKVAYDITSFKNSKCFISGPLSLIKTSKSILIDELNCLS